MVGTKLATKVTKRGPFSVWIKKNVHVKKLAESSNKIIVKWDSLKTNFWIQIRGIQDMAPNFENRNREEFFPACYTEHWVLTKNSSKPINLNLEYLLIRPKPTSHQGGEWLETF